MDSRSRSILMHSALAAVLSAIVSVPPVAAVPAVDMRSGRIDQSNFVGLTTVPVFVVPSGSQLSVTTSLPSSEATAGAIS